MISSNSFVGRACRILGCLLVLVPGTARAQASAAALAAEAVTAAGGQAALSHARALAWTADATVHLPGRDIQISGTWRILPPDSAVVATYEARKGPSSTRTLILSGAEGWLQRDTSMVPLAPALLAEERHQFYLYSLLRVLPLLDPTARLTLLAPDSAGLRGLRVEAPGRLPVDIYFSGDGLISRLHTAFATESGGPGDSQDIYLTGSLRADGVCWFQRMSILRGGQPYFDLKLISLSVDPSLTDPRLAGPRGL